MALQESRFQKKKGWKQLSFFFQKSTGLALEKHYYSSPGEPFHLIKMQLDVEVSLPALLKEFLKNIDCLLMEFNSIQIKRISPTWYLPISVTFGPVWLLVQSHPDIHNRGQCIRAHRAYAQVGSKKVENGADFEKIAIFKTTPFSSKEDYFDSLGELDWNLVLFLRGEPFFLF